MPDASFQVTAFLGGEFSQAMQGRMDDPRYKIALNSCYNAQMLETGAWTRRPGFRFAGRTPGGRPARVASFNFTSAAPYSMEFSDGLIRFRNGAAYVFLNNALTVVSISTDNPAIVRTNNPHGMGTGYYGQFGNLGTGLPLLQNRTFYVTVLDAFRFTIQDDVDGGFDGSLLGGLPVGVSWKIVYQINTTYTQNTANDWANLRVVQAEKNAILLNGNEPQLVTALSQPTTTQYATFDYRSVTFVDGPYLDPYNGNDFSAITLSSIALQHTGTSLLTLTATVLGTGVPVFGIFAATDVGRQMRLYSAPPTWQGTIAYTTNQTVLFNGQVFKALANSTGAQPDTDATKWGLQAGIQAFWIYGTIASFINTASVTLQILGPGNFGLKYGNAIEFWRLGVYSDTTGWPTCGCYHEGRVYLAGAVSNRFDSSMAGGVLVNGTNVITMSPTGFDGTVSAASGISYTLDAKDVNQILWMEPDQQGIICGTKGGEWLVQATTQNLPLSPTNIQAHRYTTTGCANIEPRRTPLTLAFVQKHQRKVMELFADVFSGRLTTPNLTETAKHLTTGGIEEIAYQQELSPTLWSRRADGTLIGCTYKRENLVARELPSFAAWHQHSHGGGRTFNSICAAGNSDGTLDTLIAVTNDPDTGVHWVEVLGDLQEETTPIEDAWFADGSVVPTYEVVVIDGTSVSLDLHGLWHLNGETVAVWAGGLDLGDYVVTDGSISVPFGDGVNSGPGGTSDTTGPWNAGGGAYLLTPALVAGWAGAMPAVVGYSYQSRGQLVRPNAREDTGARNGPGFGKKRLLNMAAFYAVNTQGLEFGTSFASGRMQPAYFTDLSGAGYAVNRLFTGIHWSPMGDDWSFDGQIAWRITRPYPGTIASTGGYLKTNDY